MVNLVVKTVLGLNDVLFPVEESPQQIFLDESNSQVSEGANYHIFLGILEYHEEIPSLGVLPAAPLKLVENHARIPCKCYPYEKTRKIISLQNMEKCTK